MIRYIILILFWPSFILGQLDKYNQQQIDTFSLTPLNKENLDRFKDILETNGALKGWSRYYTFLGYHKMKIRENDSALVYCKTAIEIFEKSKEKYPEEEKSLAYAFYTLGYINRLNGQYRKSTTYLMKALDLANKYDVIIKPYIMSSMAANHLSMGNSEKALEYYHKCIKDSFYIQSAQAEITALNRMGILYLKDDLNNVDSAYFYFKKALRRGQSSEYKNNMYSIYGNIAELFRESNIDSALFYYQKSTEAYKLFVYDPNASHSKTSLYNRINTSFINIYEKKMEKAISDLTAVIDTLRSDVTNKNDRDFLSLAYENLAIAYERNNQFKKANETLREKLAFENDFFKTQLAQELEKLQVSYETEKKEEEINELKNKAVQTKKTMEQQRIITYGYLLLGLSLLVLLGFVFRQRTLQQKMKAISLEQRLLRSQMNPHFLANALNTASMLIDTKANLAKDYILKLSKLLRLTLENSATDYVSLEDEINALQSYLELQSNFSHNFDFEISVDKDIEKEYIYIPPMLIQPFVENALIHGISKTEQRGIITVEISFCEDDSLICMVSDNGSGYDLTKNKESFAHKSMSLTIVKERLTFYSRKNRLKPYFEIKNRELANTKSRGTQVVFNLPYYKM